MLGRALELSEEPAERVSLRYRMAGIQENELQDLDKAVESYKLVLEDWVWHMILPMSSYIALFGGGLGVRQHAEWALYAIGAVAVILLCVGIHNAWDTVAYAVMVRRKQSEGGD